MEVKAQAKFQRISPRKVRLVVGMLKDMNVDQARNQLRLLPKRSASTVLKVLESAIANALNNNKLKLDDLVVTKAFVDAGPTLKRWRPRAFGRASQIRKRTSHITIMVGESGTKKARATAKTIKSVAAKKKQPISKKSNTSVKKEAHASTKDTK